MTRQFTATVHDASRCTFDGRPCWVAALEVDGRFRPSITGLLDSTEEATTADDARRLAAGLLQARGIDPAGRVRMEGK